MGVVPDHEPGDAVSVSPSCADPAIVGGDVFAGAVAGAGTTPVAADVAVVEPPEFVAVTATRRVDPWSAATTLYDAAVAPAMSAQPAPPESQRRHWYAYVI